MTKPSGWYEDPKDPSQLRYFDGVIWSSNVTPKASPTAEQSTIGMPFGVTPSAARPQAPGSRGVQDSPTAPGGYHPPDQGHSGQQDQGRRPAYGQEAGQPEQQPLGWASHLPAATPDGVVLSGWWRRVFAYILDHIIVSIVALPLTFVPLQRAGTIFWGNMRDVWAAAEAGSSTVPELTAEQTAELTGALTQFGLIVLAIYLVYEIVFLTRTGATIGRMAVGISVRLRDKPGPPPLLAVLKRTAVKECNGLVGWAPVVGLIALPFSLLDYLWPLWDDKKQAIHDKVGATNVVVGRQPKRDG